MSRGIFLAWMRFHQRSELLAQHLGMPVRYIYYGQQGRVLQAPVRYLIQAWKTWRILCRECPELIFVQNPPIFAVLVAFFYTLPRGAQYVIDSHTGAFLSGKWRWILWLHRLLSRRALVTIVHNTSQEKIVKRWGCPVFVLGDYPGTLSDGEYFPLDKRFNVAVVSSFAEDEPFEMILEAARRLPEVDFFVTGDSNRIASRLLAKKPDNCQLTGYLPYKRYLGLLKGVDAALVLTTRDHTLLAGACEAISLGTPLITSDWSILKDTFYLGTVHVPNTVEGICKGINQAMREKSILKLDISRLRSELLAQWEQKFRELQQLLSSCLGNK